LARKFGLCMLPLLAGCATPGPSTAGEFRPNTLKLPSAEGPSEVLVLGSAHLDVVPVRIEPDDLAPLLDRLARWRPDAIAVEVLSGKQCDFLRQYPDTFAGTVEKYCWDTAPAKATTGLSVSQATTEVAKTLSSWPTSPSANDRRHLAALFLAGGETVSALVQWLRLPKAERIVGDGVDASLVDYLNKMLLRQSERTMIGAVLAARLGLERVHSMDDHTDDVPVGDEEAHNEALTRIWNNSANKTLAKHYKSLGRAADHPDGLMRLYRTLNTSELVDLAYESDFGAALRDKSKGQSGRRYVGAWETRNLRMASNIREVMAREPGMRMLVIVGASHKGYLEAYLNQMHEVHIADSEAVLR
jgi:hypothetical protein